MVTLKYLKDFAKRNNIRGCSKLRKEDLNMLLRKRLPRIMGSGTTRSLLDDDIPELSQKPLQPTQYVPPTPRREGVTQKLRRWANWLLRFVPEPVKRPINSAFDTFKKKVMSLFPKQQLKFEESKKSALKGFTTHHTIKAPKNQKFDPKTFLVLYTKQSEDENVAAIFCKSLWNHIEKVWSSEVKPMVMTEDDKIDFDNATQCRICQKDFTDKDKKVRDHCHFSGKYRGASHQKCNALFRKPKFVPVKFHNLSGYDAHLFVKNLNTMGESDIDCIPNTEEKYISFSKSIFDDEKKFKYKIRFMDSFRFLPASIDKLAGNLEPNQFKYTRDVFGGECDILQRKGVFPYDWFDSFEKLKETKLPPNEEFCSKLNVSEISDSDYEQAQKVWYHFGMKTFREYHDLYLKTDVLLLADVFENFRGVCMENYELDPCWYYTTPGLAWDACLKKTGVHLELLSDIDMLLMIEKGIRGEVSMIPT